VDSLVEWCRRGPSMAKVGNVAVRDDSPSGATSFEVSY
jgi:hypothetical protein